MEPHDAAYFHWSAPVGLSTAGQRFNRGSVRGQGHEVGAPENDELSYQIAMRLKALRGGDER